MSRLLDHADELLIDSIVNVQAWKYRNPYLRRQNTVQDHAQGNKERCRAEQIHSTVTHGDTR